MAFNFGQYIKENDKTYVHNITINNTQNNPNGRLWISSNSSFKINDTQVSLSSPNSYYIRLTVAKIYNQPMKIIIYLQPNPSSYENLQKLEEFIVPATNTEYSLDDINSYPLITLEKVFTIIKDINYYGLVIHFFPVDDNTTFDTMPYYLLNLEQIQELLNNFIPHNKLTHIGIQGKPGTYCLINGSCTHITSNGIFEMKVKNNDFSITSLKIIPKGFFLIDYEY